MVLWRSAPVLSCTAWPPGAREDNEGQKRTTRKQKRTVKSRREEDEEHKKRPG